MPYADIPYADSPFGSHVKPPAPPAAGPPGTTVLAGAQLPTVTTPLPQILVGNQLPVVTSPR